MICYMAPRCQRLASHLRPAEARLGCSFDRAWWVGSGLTTASKDTEDTSDQLPVIKRPSSQLVSGGYLWFLEIDSK